MRTAVAIPTLLDEVASLKAQLEHCQAQAIQVELLRKLGSWQIDLDAGALSWSEGDYRIFGLSPDEPVTVEHALTFRPAEARRVAPEERLDTTEDCFARSIAVFDGWTRSSR